MVKCPRCGMMNMGYLTRDREGVYRFRECSCPIPMDPKPDYKTMRDFAIEAGVHPEFNRTGEPK